MSASRVQERLSRARSANAKAHSQSTKRAFGYVITDTPAPKHEASLSTDAPPPPARTRSESALPPPPSPSLSPRQRKSWDAVVLQSADEGTAPIGRTSSLIKQFGGKRESAAVAVQAHAVQVGWLRAAESAAESEHADGHAVDSPQDAASRPRKAPHKGTSHLLPAVPPTPATDASPDSVMNFMWQSSEERRAAGRSRFDVVSRTLLFEESSTSEEPAEQPEPSTPRWP
eukprot:CAMPEP_0119374900 /NCGR_PEP_ID=MMETSP1334-20130426/33409_1 /TAXON_ID=127549 /ORGANISM="Calcidiscus leptoporus, Strain RCC1130" /LENGTH=228 /DNA_ID=CAMNT_0007393089 /DNA_START=46 /DNA_END=729 /DNA_ORIENTATION=-